MRKNWKFIALGSAAVCMFGLVGCGSDNNNNNNSAPAGVYKLNLAGGTGGTAHGGSGGNIYIDNYADVKILQSGSVDAAFTVPTYAKNFGEVKATISVDTVVQLDADAVVGGYYMISNDSNLYLGDGDGVLANAPDADDKVVTGLQVNAGKTIKFPNNFTMWGPTANYVWFDNAVVIDGTVTVVTEGHSLDIESGSLLQINASGKVTTTTTTAGINSGSVYLYSDGVLINNGNVTADAAADASADNVELDGETFCFNTGAMSANGGHSTTGSGGSAGSLYLYSYYAGLFTSGNLTANGGNGGAGDGGQGGYLYLEGGYQGYMGDTYVSGNLTANGGNGTDGNGGNAYYVEIYNSSGGELKVNAKISAAGGAGSGAAYSGGSGASCYIEMDSYGYDYGYGEYAPMGDIAIAGNFDLSGGNGAAAGGSGGYLSIDGYEETYYILDPNKRAPTITLAGFNAINISGGNSTDAAGGSAGNFDISTEDASNDDPYLPVGAIVNEAAITAKGGNGATTGGYGGYLEWEAEGEAYIGTTIVKNTGAIDLSGGTGDTGGDAGGLYFYGFDGVTNTAIITANGGNGVSQGGNGTYRNIEMYATIDIKNSGSIFASGGNGVTGGNGSEVDLYAGGQVTNSGQIKVSGGNGSTDGGSGGYIDLFSQTRPTANSGQLNVAKGTGGTTAANGTIWLDWVDVTPTSGTL
ncbi:MAG: hypothetical protein U1D97_07410 [Desulfuromonadales bacterium]|nr:hypothetical protein [Desulfuromonadales bacterium]